MIQLEPCRIPHLELSCCQSTCRATIISPLSRYKLSTYPNEPVEMALLCLKLVSTLQLPKSHNCSHPKLMSRSSKSRDVHVTTLNCLVYSVKDELPPSLKFHAGIPSWRGLELPTIATLSSNISTFTARPDIVPFKGSPCC